MSKVDYYNPPSDEVFNDIKKNSIKIWNTYDNEYGYVDEKLGRIEGLENIQDNAWMMVSMFDPSNQFKLLAMVKPATAILIRKARGY